MCVASSTAICLRRMGAQSFRTPCALHDPIGRAGQWILQMMMERESGVEREREREGGGELLSFQRQTRSAP